MQNTEDTEHVDHVENVEHVEKVENVEINKVYRSREKNVKLRKVVYYILGIIEAFFAFRLIFKILGANPESMFVAFMYNVSGVLLAPFNGIFGVAVNEGIETKSVLEPATIIAMIVYALVAYAVIALVEIYRTPKDKSQR